MKDHKKHVVVLAHADGWGAVSANKIVRHLHAHYPDIAIHLVVSKATRNKDGQILTKLGDLAASRELKETNLLAYFEQIDAMSKDIPISVPPPSELFTFEQLGKYCCADHQVHYTTRGGPKGGEEVGAVIADMEAKKQAPEVILSVDTMAILPKGVLEKYPSFSTHPGPLDTVAVEGMQGTMRQLCAPMLFDEHDNPLPADHVLGFGLAYAKGTLFLQAPELDKGPPIDVVRRPVVPGMSSYQVRDEIYDALTDAMIVRLPEFLHREARDKLIAEAHVKKAALDAGPRTHVGELMQDQLDRWQGGAIEMVDSTHPNGVEVIQNQIVDPAYFKRTMRQFYPHGNQTFDGLYEGIFGNSLAAIAQQKDDHLKDPWARLYAGKDITIRQYYPGTEQVAREIQSLHPGYKIKAFDRHGRLTHIQHGADIGDISLF